MSNMFFFAGYWKATTFSIDLSNWDTSSVINMEEMFDNAGLKASYSLELSDWNVNKVTSRYKFNYGVTDKITPPTWVK